MNKNIVITILLVALVSSNIAWLLSNYDKELIDHDIGHLQLDIRQRDVVIEEMASVITHQNLNKDQNEIINILKKNPITKEHPPFYEAHDNLIEFGTTLKFEFKEGKLTNVYW